jgi:tetratricopeptide (TPR) repeat protein
MQRRRASVLTILATIGLLPARLDAQPPERAAEVVSVQGQGESRVGEAGAWKPAAAQQELFPRDYVRTGAYSRMGLLFRDRTQVRLAEKTLLQIKSAPPSPAEATVLRLEQGRSWSQTNRTPSNLYLETPSATAAIRGTDWEVEVFEGGRSLLTVLAGEVVFSNDQGSVTVGRNEQAQATPGQAPVKLLIANPRSRVQWVTAYSIDAARHIDSAAPGAERARLEGIAEMVRAERLEQAYAAAVAEIDGGQATQPAAWLIASDLMANQGRLERANDFVQQGLARFPDEPRLVAQFARIALASGDIDEARRRIAPALTATQPSFEARLVGADVARASGVAGEARGGYEVARAERPSDDRPWYGLGVVDSEREAIASGRAALLAALERNPKGPGYQGELGTLETFAGRLGEADAAFAAALSANPSDYVALTGGGLLQLKRGEHEAALESFLRAGTLEPRYARARMYVGVAQFQLGRVELALRELARASELDDKDPLPHLLASMILADQYRIAEAIEEARLANSLLKYLKSLNQVANDLQGSANLGRSLSLFGLEEWAQSRAQESYFPYWAGSNLFLADRYNGEFNKNSSLLQGFISDPTVFGASNRSPTLVQSPGQYGRLLLGYGYSEEIDALIPIGRYSGLSVRPGFPLAWLVDADITRFDYSGDRRGKSDGHTVTAAVGARPTHELGVFAYGFDSRADDDVETASIGYQMKVVTSSLNAGASYRFGPASQLWLRAGLLHNSHDNSGQFRAEPFTSVLDHDQPEYGVRHTFELGRHQIGWGYEAAHKELTNPFTSFPFENASITTNLVFDERSRNGYVSDTADFGPLRVQADAWWQDSRRELNVAQSGMLGSIAVPGATALEERSRKKVTPRVGARYRIGGRALVRAAYQDWIRPLGTSTLGPVATAGVPMDDRLVARGGWQKRARGQLEWAGAKTFGTLYYDWKELDNLRFGYEPFFITEDENLAKLRNFDYGQLAAEDLYEFISPPSFDGARIEIAGASLNRILTRTFSLRLRYEYTESRNTGQTHAGKRVPYLPAHAFAPALTYMGPRRVYATARAVYRTQRYADEANLAPLQAGWDVASDIFWESPGKRFRVRFSLDNWLHEEKPTLYTLVGVVNF